MHSARLGRWLCMLSISGSVVWGSCGCGTASSVHGEVEEML